MALTTTRLDVFFGLALLALLPGTGLAEPSLRSDHDVKIDESKPRPGVLFSDFLKSASDQVFWEKGQLRFFHDVRMTFLPEFKDPKNVAPYNVDTGARLAHQIKNAKGDVVSTVLWIGRPGKFPFWSASAANNSNPGALEPGSYTITFLIEGQPFWRSAFRVSQDAAADAYSKPKNYIDGPWSEWSYIWIPNGNLDGSGPVFSIFLRDKASKPGAWTEAEPKVEIRRGKKLVAVHPGGGASKLRLRPWWERADLSLHPPGKGRQGMPVRELLKTGVYTVRVTLDGKLHGTYRYKAKGGKMPQPGRQNRKTAKPLEYLENANDRFYIRRTR